MILLHHKLESKESLLFLQNAIHSMSPFGCLNRENQMRLWSLLVLVEMVLLSSIAECLAGLNIRLAWSTSIVILLIKLSAIVTPTLMCVLTLKFGCLPSTKQVPFYFHFIDKKVFHSLVTLLFDWPFVSFVGYFIWLFLITRYFTKLSRYFTTIMRYFSILTR